MNANNRMIIVGILTGFLLIFIHLALKDVLKWLNISNYYYNSISAFVTSMLMIFVLIFAVFS